jgi:hypothetical protein
LIEQDVESYDLSACLTEAIDKLAVFVYVVADREIGRGKVVFPRVPVDSNDDDLWLSLGGRPETQPEIIYLQIHQPKPAVQKAQKNKQDSQRSG